MARRRAIGLAINIARIIGLTLIILAIAGLPPVRFMIGNAANTFTIISSVILGVVGIVWLVAVQLFLRFFDQFLSRN